ncbi:glycosyltransferase [Motiliproteus sp. SC1-56]|uniref:glycosyltransferase n=1 Tax=Motiliproteus sp. SC1-56 TaxID=2799565 RepID=UPI001A8FDD19|nr:glycosyltransferase [Motiliproteus sp. SC1-56]
MHICHVNLSKGFRGGERQTGLLIRELAARGFTQALVCRATSPLREHLADVDNLRFHTANSPLGGHRLGRRGVDLLHAHDGRAVHWCLLENALGGAPYLITRRVPNPLKTRASTRLAYRRSSCVVALSRAIETGLHAYDPALTTRVIPSMCAHLDHDPEAAAAIRQRYPGKFLVGHIGALVNKHKGQRHLIEAARQLAPRCPELHFLFLGQGRDEAMLKAEAEGLDNVEFLGFKSNVGDYLAALDLFAFPSLEEGLGSVLFDVMEYRVPIVASRVDGIPDIVEHQANGLLVPPADASALAEAIETLYRDPDYARHLAAEGARRLPAYSPSAIADRYTALYRELTENR